ncbi:hypothetical protein [Streptomyces sp. NPDC006739]|uniref:hypothetical protein n=1 Tax=Streptomyces sp. NPDC006739 TaxID=3364763 RepID=UPI0036BBAF2A
MCLYYNSQAKNWGSFENWSPNQAVNLYAAKFAHWGNGSGYGVVVGGNAASIVNNTDHTVEVDLANGGNPVFFDPQYSGSLNAAWNNDAYMWT